MTKRVHVLLFDVDGTLLLSGGAGAGALNLAFDDLFGVARAMRSVRPHGKTDVVISQEMFRAHLGRDGSDDEVSRLLARYVELLPHTVGKSKNFHLMPGIPGLLGALERREDVVMGLGTGNIEAGARIKLERGALNRYFSFGGFGSDSADRAELLDAGFSRGEERARESHPGAEPLRWVIGDTWRDVAAGRACGARTVGVATGGDSLYRLAEAHPDYVYADFSRGGSFLELLGA